MISKPQCRNRPEWRWAPLAHGDSTFQSDLCGSCRARVGGCSPQAMNKNETMEDRPGPRVRWIFKVLVNLCLWHCMLGEFQTYLLQWVEKRKERGAVADAGRWSLGSYALPGSGRSWKHWSSFIFRSQKWIVPAVCPPWQCLLPEPICPNIFPYSKWGTCGHSHFLVLESGLPPAALHIWWPLFPRLPG